VSSTIGNDPKLNGHARALRLGLLSNSLRETAALRLEDSALREMDLCYFDDEDMLDLIPPMRLVELGLALKIETLPKLEERIEAVTCDADLYEDPADHFQKISAALKLIENIGLDDGGIDLIDKARSQFDCSIESLEDRKRERDEENDSTDGTHIVTQKSAPPPVPCSETMRSIFDDVDRG